MIGWDRLSTDLALPICEGSCSTNLGLCSNVPVLERRGQRGAETRAGWERGPVDGAVRIQSPRIDLRFDVGAALESFGHFRESPVQRAKMLE